MADEMHTQTPQDEVYITYRRKKTGDIAAPWRTPATATSTIYRLYARVRKVR